MITNKNWKLNLATPILVEDRTYVKKPFSIAKQIAKERNNLPLSNFVNSQMDKSENPKRSATVLPSVQLTSAQTVNPNTVMQRFVKPSVFVEKKIRGNVFESLKNHRFSTLSVAEPGMRD